MNQAVPVPHHVLEAGRDGRLCLLLGGTGVHRSLDQLAVVPAAEFGGSADQGGGLARLRHHGGLNRALVAIHSGLPPIVERVGCASP